MNQDNLLVICENNYKEKFLRKSFEKKEFLNVKFYTKREFFKKYFFDYTNKTIYYLVKKFNLKIEVAKIYLENLYYIDETKKYKSDKLNFLVNLKNELLENNLLVFDEYFKDYIKKFDINIYGYSFLQKHEEDVLNKLGVKIIEDEDINNKIVIYENKTIEDEINFVAKKISELLEKGISINKIKLVGVSSDYYILLKRIFDFYNIPIKIPFNYSLIGNSVVRKFLDNLFLGVNESLKLIENANSKIIDKIINVCNKYVFINDIGDLKKFLIYEFSNISLDNYEYINYIEITDLNYPFEDEYVFLMNFNVGSIPSVYKDEEYITDNIKEEVGLKTTKEINISIKNWTIKKLKSIKNLVISYKTIVSGQDAYLSFLASELNSKVIFYENDILTSYSLVYDKVNYAKKLDLYYKYGTVDETLKVYHSNMGDILYNSFDNKYTKIDNSILKKYLNEKLVLSYSSLDNYNKCSFRYYLGNILKLDIYEEKFETFLGNLFHYILIKWNEDDLDIDDRINDYLISNNINLNKKESFFVDKLKEQATLVVDVLKGQYKHSLLKDFYTEKRFEIDKSKDIDVKFVGFIDKILYRQNESKALVALVDYKTGSADINLKYLPFGLNMQLAIYLYLVSKSNLFVNPKFIGFYLQSIFTKESSITPGKSYLSMKEDNLKLNGYSINDPDLLEKFDDTYLNSEVIKSMKVKADGNFYNYAKVLNENNFELIIKMVEDILDKSISDILNAKFDINPKVIDFKDNVGCQYCKFKDICFKKEKDNVNLLSDDNLEFLGGE